MKPTLYSIFVALGALVLSVLPAQAQEVKGDVEAARGKVAMCIGCHGIPDYKTAFPEVYRVPRIAGQNTQYLVAALEDYRKGDRKHPSMRAIAETLSDQDIADVAAYYAQLGGDSAGSLPSPSEPGATVADLLKKGTCASCHGENYSAPIDPSYPKLAGQHPDYLFVALKSYRDDSQLYWGRGNPIMAAQVKQFSNAELKAMAKYIATLPGEVKTIGKSKLALGDNN